MLNNNKQQQTNTSSKYFLQTQRKCRLLYFPGEIMLIPNMAGPTTASTFVCSCFFTNNIFVKKYKLHVSYQDRSQFFDNYSKVSARVLFVIFVWYRTAICIGWIRNCSIQVGISLSSIVVSSIWYKCNSSLNQSYLDRLRWQSSIV